MSDSETKEYYQLAK